MQQVAQRVTTACELRPLTREGVGGYVLHRLAVAGGTRDRVEFSSAALDLVFAASAGIPRLVNRICDRALFYGHLDRASELGQAQVHRAIQELELPAPSVTTAPTVAPVATAAAPTAPTMGGLFVKTTNDDAPSSGIDLQALLELPTVARRTNDALASSRVERSPATHRSTHRRPWWKKALSALAMPTLAMAVTLFAGGVAVSTVGKGSVTSELPALPPPPTLFPSLPVRAASTPSPSLPVDASETWVVQVAAFATPGRSVAMVQQLADSGWPAYQVEPDASTRGLTIVRVGPFRSVSEADEARARLRATPDYEGAFVRNITR
ncbi:MAG TPA: SPOR domain-containing protein, partial [Vicinamibacterales bacterium]|nr:SPOR domain-containing protein [Vicinamibacterales bacterium]